MHHSVDAFRVQDRQVHCEIGSAEFYLDARDDLKQSCFSKRH